MDRCGLCHEPLPDSAVLRAYAGLSVCSDTCLKFVRHHDLRPDGAGERFELNGASEAFRLEFGALASRPQPGTALTDLGLAERIAMRHGDRLRHAGGTWYVYDGKRWSRDETAEIDRLAKDTVRNLYVEAEDIADDRDRKAFVKWVVGCESNSRITAALARARSEPPIPCRPDEFDAEPFLLNVQNGTLDLRTGELHAHRSDEMISKIASVRYDRTAKSPTWEAFLRKILRDDADLIRYVQKSVGYSLTGDTSEQCLFILNGHGANGKSTFLETIGALFGDYATTIQPQTLLMLKNRSAVGEDVAALQGARMVKGAEFGQSGRLDEARIKSLTGGDSITCRRLYENPITFHPRFKLWLSTNHLPTLNPDFAIMRRLRIIPFNVTIPREEQDKGLAQKLLAELPGILNWSIAGFAAYVQEGLQPPATVNDATRDYGKENDVVGAFVEERCVERVGALVGLDELYGVYEHWAKCSGVHPLSKIMFGKRLLERGFTKVRTKAWYWNGLGLRNEHRDEPDTEEVSRRVTG